MPPPLSTFTPDFHVVLEHELDQIAARRQAVLGEAEGKHPPPDPPSGASAVQIATAAARDRAKRMNLFGVSFSGGGIRSGTFCLGVLQALGKLKLLRHVDYLSTVSGGGYIGGWLAAWIRREADGLAQPPFARPNPSGDAISNVERQLDPDRGVQARAFRRDSDSADARRTDFAEDREPAPLHHLRAHSRYLSPRVGLLSLDTWTLFAIYLRNLFVNALIFVPLLAFVVLAVRVAVRAVAEPSSPNQTLRWSLFAGFLSLLVCAQLIMRIGLNHVRERTNPRGWWRNAALIGFCLLAASLLAVWLTAPDVHDWRPQSGQPAPNRMPNELRRSHEEAGGVTLYTVVPDVFRQDYVGGASFFAGFGLLFGVLVWVMPGVAGGYGRWYLGGLHMLFLAWFGAVFGALFEVVVNNFLYLDGRNHPALFATFGPPLFLASLVVAAYAEVALAGGWYSDHEREWRSRLAAWLFLLAVGWLAVFATVVYVPQLFDNRGGTATTGVVVLLSAALRFLVPHLSKSPGLMTWAAVKVVPALFLVALLALVAAGVDRIVAQDDPPAELLAATGGVAESAVASSYAGRLEGSHWRPIWTALTLALGLFLLFFRVVPVNRFSLHALYANRLIRGYLGASRRPPPAHLAQRTCVPTAAHDERAANEFSGFDPHDDLPLVALSAGHRIGGAANPYPGPLPLFNTALNLVTGGELAYQDRKADSFVLSPDYCGSSATGYARLNGGRSPTATEFGDTLDRFWHLTVGRAVTISGAAVDPNMANYYSEQFTAFLTVLNARLGWWMANPNPEPPAPGRLRRLWRAVKPTLKKWARFRDEPAAGKVRRAWWRFKGWLKIQLGYQRRTPWDATPPAGSKHYLKELLGYTDAAQANVHLSDGGHFENTGAYELIRRRCRFVLLVDAAENTDTTSENLANLVRLVHADFGIRIQIDTTPLRRSGADGRTSDWHCAVGAIRYDDVDAGGVIGTLLFLRSSLTGDEPPDIRNYAATNPAFPHHPTAHQFFDAAQFESYRGLGYHIGMSVLAEAADSAHTHAPGPHFLRRLFGKLRRAWTPCSAAQKDQYIQSCGEYLPFVEGLAAGANPARVRQDIFGEAVESFGGLRLPADLPPDADLATVDRMVQIMELAWLRNDLDRTYTHPIQRGWVNVLRRWSTADVFQRFWPVVRCHYSQAFVRFCERALNVNRPSVCLVPVGGPGDVPMALPDWSALRREFGEEFLPYLRGEVETGPGERAPRWASPPGDYLTEVRRKAGGDCWLIVYDQPHHLDGIHPDCDREGIGPIVGFVAAFAPILRESCRDTGTGPAGTREFLLWVRGPYRMAGVGAVAMRLLFDPKTEEDPGLKRLREERLFARLPRVGSGPAEQLQRAMWVQFMNDFDFYGVQSAGTDWEQSELRVEYKPPVAGGNGLGPRRAGQ